jgi:enoyl-CoA hydratase/carnithine racemase
MARALWKGSLAFGLVNHVVPRPELVPRAVELAREIMRNGPFAVRQAKWAIDHGVDASFEDGLERV